MSYQWDDNDGGEHDEEIDYPEDPLPSPGRPGPRSSHSRRSASPLSDSEYHRSHSSRLPRSPPPQQSRKPTKSQQKSTPARRKKVRSNVQESKNTATSNEAVLDNPPNPVVPWPGTSGFIALGQTPPPGETKTVLYHDGSRGGTISNPQKPPSIRIPKELKPLSASQLMDQLMVKGKIWSTSKHRGDSSGETSQDPNERESAEKENDNEGNGKEDGKRSGSMEEVGKKPDEKGGEDKDDQDSEVK